MLSKSANLFSKNVIRATNAAVFTQQVPQRGIKLHEYQAGQLLHKYNVSIPLGQVAFSKEEAMTAASSFEGHKVVKSQILGGGRGMGHFRETQFQGGVHIVPTAQDAADVAGKMIGNHLVTKQSGENGLPVNCVYIVEKVNIDKEMYLSITLDRAAGCATFIYSPAGGMAIEDVAHETPEKIFKLPVDPVKGIDACDLSQVATNLGIAGKEDQVNQLLKQLYACFVERDCDMVEINPLITTKDGVVMCADSKVTIDSNAAFRQKELADAQDTTQENEKEQHASKYDLNYIHIGGDIGCLVNGAGLAMSTMDIIKLYGGEPANFLDVGGNAGPDQMVEAMKLLNGDETVKAIFINIFGGILRCDKLTESIIMAAEKVSLTKPIVLRLKGTNADIAKDMIKGKEQELGIYYNEDFDSAAQLVCKIASEQ